MRESVRGQDDSGRQSATTQPKRQLTDHEEQACRDKADGKVILFLREIETLPVDEKIVRMRGKFSQIWDITNKCSENFDIEKYVERQNAAKTEGELKALISASITGVHMMRRLCKEMEAVVTARPDLASDHQASDAFTRCATIASGEENRLSLCKRVFASGDNDIVVKPPGQTMAAALACKIIQLLFPAAMTFADIIAV